ncbi:reverse transcriptase domain-containing protein [Polyangium mundeleinium]|uniref:Reverse transcriptase domain-containing protein n=1 Tax=Polyangium mundeleinium TaxID=2995306 RepID=A0ABT5EVL4_9BACT|nr:reverse transcriptase domain-containing protein [Polyangium mundeleinium]MDC0745409.1 reverse transcriptase domain-containing protein [Polyangium mundeleinium]
MTATKMAEPMSPGLLKVAERAKRDPEGQLLSLAHLIDEAALERAFGRIRKDAAVGVDGITKEQYGQELASNLRVLHGRLKEMTYRHQPIRRVHTALGSPLRENRTAGSARGDEPKGNQGPVPTHHSIDRTMLMEMLQARVADGKLLRLVGKCLHVGVLEGAEISEPDTGTVQGSVLSPLLGNVYLHHVLDVWFEREVKPRMRGKTTLARYADDFVIGFELYWPWSGPLGGQPLVGSGVKPRRYAVKHPPRRDVHLGCPARGHLPPCAGQPGPCSLADPRKKRDGTAFAMPRRAETNLGGIVGRMRFSSAAFASPG